MVSNGFRSRWLVIWGLGWGSWLVGRWIVDWAERIDGKVDKATFRAAIYICIKMQDMIKRSGRGRGW